MLVQESILIECKTEGCQNTFRFVPRQQFNSTVRVKPPEYCQCCLNRKRFEKSKPATQKWQQSDKQNTLFGRRKAPIKKNNFSLKSQLAVNTDVTDKIKRLKSNIAWHNKSTSELTEHVQRHFCNRYIRMRDAANFKSVCISCGIDFVSEAGHFLAIGSHPEMRLLIHNVHGQCNHCNQILGGNQKAYEIGIISRYGEEYLTQLRTDEFKLANSNVKLHRHEIIDIGRTYQHLIKNKIWVFTPEEFNLYLELIKE